MSKYYFKDFPNTTFIETGSYVGDGISEALKSQFDKIISIELSNKYYNHCVNRFSNHDNVDIYLGDSVDVLPEILSEIDTRITFWLDGHHSGGDTACGDNPVPLKEELSIIKNHHIKTHTILIDDIRLLRNHLNEWSDLNYSVKQLEDFIMDINPDYSISYRYGMEKNDILIAEVK